MDVPDLANLDYVTPELVMSATSQLGVTLGSVELTGLGQKRTAFAVTTDGPVVVKWSADRSWAAGLPRAVRIADRLRTRGYLIPQTIVFGPVPALGTVWVIERLAGVSPADGLNPSQLQEILSLVELQRDAAAVDVDHPGWSWVDACVFDDKAGWWKAARARDVGPLCDELRSWLDAAGPQHGPGTDYAHLDLNLGNILVHDNKVSAVIDIDHFTVACRSVDIACLAFDHARLADSADSAIAANALAALELLCEAGRAVGGEPAWRRAVVYNASARVGWRGDVAWRAAYGQDAGSLAARRIMSV